MCSGLVLVLSQPDEELRGGLDGHALAGLLGRVVALLPRVEGLHADDVGQREGLEDLVQQSWNTGRIKT